MSSARRSNRLSKFRGVLRGYQYNTPLGTEINEKFILSHCQGRTEYVLRNALGSFSRKDRSSAEAPQFRLRLRVHLRGNSDTCAETIRHPSVKRTHTWLCLPLTIPLGVSRSNSSVMLPKSRPKLTISNRFTLRCRLAAGRLLRNASSSVWP